MEIAVSPEVTYTATGTTTTYSFPFDYLRKAYVKVKIEDETVSNYTVNNKTVVFTEPPEEGDTIYIYRNTPTTRLVSWADASVLKASNLTIQQVQELHILEEQQVWQQTAYEETIKELQDIEEDISDIIPKTEAIYNNTVTVYNNAVTDTGAIKTATQGIYNSAVTDTTAIKTATQGIYDNAVADTTAIKTATQGIHDQTVTDATAIKNQTAALVNDADAYSKLAKKWAESATSPDGLVTSKSSKTWAEQTASYLDEAVNLRAYAEALAAQVEVWSASKEYHIGDVVMMSDGSTYRCLTTNTGENPQESYKWAKVQTVDADTFEKDANGNVMVRLPATASSQWDVDDNGDIMIKPVM